MIDESQLFKWYLALDCQDLYAGQKSNHLVTRRTWPTGKERKVGGSKISYFISASRGHLSDINTFLASVYHLAKNMFRFFRDGHM